MIPPMTHKAPEKIGTFNSIVVWDCRQTTSMEGLKPGDMYITQVLLTGELYAMRLNGNSRLVGIDRDLSAIQAFCEAVDHLIQLDYERHIVEWKPAVVAALSEHFYKELSKHLNEQAQAVR